MNFEKHPIWEVVTGAEDFRSFKVNVLPKTVINPNAPEGIKGYLKVVSKLLDFSYYEYEFLDLALLNCIFLFEKALRIKHKEITGKDSNLKFYQLLDKFYEEGYFEIYNKGVLDQLRRIRNDKVHKVDHNLGGLAFLHKIVNTIHLINDLYEDLDLRKERERRIKEIKQVFSKYGKGFMLEIQDKKYIVDQVSPFFINNKTEKNTCYFFVLPIFNPQKYLNNSLQQPWTFTIKLSDLKIIEAENKILSGLDIQNGHEVFIKKLDSKNGNKYRSWHNEVNNLDHVHTIYHLLEWVLDNEFTKAKSEFYEYS